MPKSIAIQKQIDQVKIWLSQGLTREEICKNFSKTFKNFQATDRTIDNRIKQAKKQAQPIIDKGTEKVDSKILEKEKKALNELTRARIKAQIFLSNTINEIVDYGEALKKKDPNDLSYLQVFKTANKSGFNFEKILPAVRLEEGLPNTINKNENINKNVSYDDLMKALDDDDQ